MPYNNDLLRQILTVVRCHSSLHAAGESGKRDFLHAVRGNLSSNINVGDHRAPDLLNSQFRRTPESLVREFPTAYSGNQNPDHPQPLIGSLVICIFCQQRPWPRVKLETWNKAQLALGESVFVRYLCNVNLLYLSVLQRPRFCHLE